MKLRNALLLLLSAAVIVVGSVLPKWVSSWRDGTGQISYAKVSNVQLEFSGSESSLSLRSKLALLSGYGISMEIPVSLTKLSTSDILDITDETIAQYQELGLITAGIDTVSVEQQPYLVYWDDSKTRSNIFWNVFAYFGDELSLTLIIDDETKTVCSIVYGRSDGWYEEYADYTKQTLSIQAQTLCKAFLEGLGTEFSNYDPATIMTSVNTEWNDDENGLPSFSTYIFWSDILFGEIHIGFYVNPSGFSTYIW